MDKIKVSYCSIDHYSKTRSFKTLAGAQRFAQKMVGETPEIGSYYAVSGDGIGKVTVTGASLQDLFPKSAWMAGDDEEEYRGLGYMQGRGAS